jgi:hypothetical protein
MFAWKKKSSRSATETPRQTEGLLERSKTWPNAQSRIHSVYPITKYSTKSADHNYYRKAGFLKCSHLFVGPECTLPFYVNVTVHLKFLFNKTNRRTNVPNLFCQETLHVSGSSSVHHQEFSTVHWALVYVMQVWWQLSSTTRIEQSSILSSILVVLESCHQTCMTYTSTECTVENSWWSVE